MSNNEWLKHIRTVILAASDVAVSGEAQTLSAGAASGAESGQIGGGHLLAR